ncbi:MAG: OmpA family protein, partial [Bacteroidetes bacterium]|nr:OmpA family protein [Bacteroidota bacterium]
SSHENLDSLGSFLLENPELKIQLTGHTDNSGTVAHNLQLSEKRAKAVTTYLINHGVNRNRIIFKGYGASIPISDNSSNEGRRLNRRVEFIISLK